MGRLVDIAGTVVLAGWRTFCWVARIPRNHQQAREWNN